MPAHEPPVSVLTPSYNQGRFLPDCLHSIASQDYPHVEHIVCDGGSTDESVQVLSAAGDSLRWVSEPDRGQSHAVNKALAMSSGDIIGWVNSDDALFTTDAISRVVRVFTEDESVDVVFGDAAVVDGAGRILRHQRTRTLRRRRMRIVAVPIVQPAAFIRRSAIEAEGFLREDLHLAMDQELWLRLRSRGARFRHVRRVLAIDRDHSNRKVRLLRDTSGEEYEKISRRYGVVFEARRSDPLLDWLRRLGGLVEVMRWERYRPAFGWWTDGRPARLRRQLLLTHARQTGDAIRELEGRS